VKLVYVHNGGHYGGKDISVGGERYEVRREGSRSVVEIPDVFAANAYGAGFEPEGIATARIVEVAAQAELSRQADDKKKAQMERLARAGRLPYIDEYGNAMNQAQLDDIDAQLKTAEENQQLKQRLMALEAKLDMLVGSDKPQEQKAEPLLKDDKSKK